MMKDFEIIQGNICSLVFDPVFGLNIAGDIILKKKIQGGVEAHSKTSRKSGRKKVSESVRKSGPRSRTKSGTQGDTLL